MGTTSNDGSERRDLQLGLAARWQSHTITALYNGSDTSFTRSVSPTVTQVVNQSASGTVLVPSINPTVFGQSTVLTATVSPTSPGAGSPSGTITFKDSATTIGTATLNNGVATLAVGALSVSTHSLTAVYSGDTNFSNSTSAAVNQVVNQSASGTVLVSSANPSVFRPEHHAERHEVSATAPGRRASRREQ